VEEDLRSRLIAEAAVLALVGTRVSWVDRPQGSALPAITLQMISPGRIYTHGGANDLADSRVQIDCWGDSYGAARGVARAVLAAMEAGVTQGNTDFARAFLDGERDMPAEDLAGGVKVFRTSMDFIIWHQPVT
jgi:hypothetical protein